MVLYLDNATLESIPNTRVPSASLQMSSQSSGVTQQGVVLTDLQSLVDCQ
jgi:hypothetical protein